MDQKKDRPAANGDNGRDAGGRFGRGNTAAVGRGRPRVNVKVRIPAALQAYPGVVAMWPLWTQLAAAGSTQALELVSNLTLGNIHPKSIGEEQGDREGGYEDDGGEVVDGEHQDWLQQYLVDRSKGERNAIRDLLRNWPVGADLEEE